MKIGKGISLLLCLVLLGGLCSCGSSFFTDDADENADAVHLYVRGEAENTEDVLNYFAEKLPDVPLVVTGIPAEEYEETVAALQAAGSPVDIVVMPVNAEYYAAARSGAYVDLTAALGTTLRDAADTLGDDFIRANKTDGALYGIPTAEYRTQVDGIVYRQDLLFSYALDFGEITSTERLKAYLQRAAATYNTPLLLGEDGFSLVNWNEKTLASNHIFPLPGYRYTELPAAVILNEDDTQVRAVVFAGDSADAFRAAPAAYRRDFLSDALLRNADMADFAGNAAQLDARFAKEGFLDNDAAAWVTPLSDEIPTWEVSSALRTQDVELGYYAGDNMYYSAVLQTKTPLVTDMRADYMLCIPAASTHQQEAMQVLNTLYANVDNLETFMYGVRGQDWNIVTANTYARLRSSAPYEMPARQFAQPTAKRMPDTMNFYVYPLVTNLSNGNNYVLSPLAGFTLRFAEDDAAWAYVRTLYRNGMEQLNFGSYRENTRDEIDALHEKAVAGGLEDLRAEIAAQVQAFLDENTTVNTEES